jgi:hypothetical protein
MAATGFVIQLVVTLLLDAPRRRRFRRTQIDIFAKLIGSRDALPAERAMIPARPQPRRKG